MGKSILGMFNLFVCCLGLQSYNILMLQMPVCSVVLLVVIMPNAPILTVLLYLASVKTDTRVMGIHAQVWFN